MTTTAGSFGAEGPPRIAARFSSKVQAQVARTAQAQVASKVKLAQDAVIARAGLSREALEAAALENRKIFEHTIVSESRAILAEAIKRTERAEWIAFKSKSDNDCSYFGIYQYQNTLCTDENLSTLQFAFDLYERAYQLATRLARSNPDTFGLAEQGFTSFDDAALDARCTVLADPKRPELSAKLTWRGYARLQWYKAVCYVTSTAFWATNRRTGFLYGIGKTQSEIYHHHEAAGAPWTVADADLWAWGPDTVKQANASLWGAARTAGKQFFLPLPTQAFLAASQDPGLDQPWLWEQTGRLVDTQRLAEYKRGRARREERRAERADRAGFFGTADMWRAIGGGERCQQCPKNAPWQNRLPEAYDPTYSLPPDFELALLFSTQGSGLFPLHDLVGKGDKSWVVPTGPLLVQHTRRWLDEVLTKDIIDHTLRSQLVYFDYLARFMERTPLSEVDPSQIAGLRAQGAVIREGNREYVVWIPSSGLTLQELEKFTRDVQKARSMKVAGTINSVLVTIAALVAKVGGVYGVIVAVVIIVVAALIQLFTWLFGGSLVGCPKAPRLPTLRTFDDPRCNADIAKSGQTIEEGWNRLAAGARQVGINISFPSSKPPPAPPPLPPNSDPLDIHFPGFDFTPPPPPAAKKSALVPTLLIGGALATGAYFLLRK